MDNAIPVARGLGSSAAATVAALTAADALLGGGALTLERRLELAAAAEGHADNAAAAILGGVGVVSHRRWPAASRPDRRRRRSCAWPCSSPTGRSRPRAMRAALPATRAVPRRGPQRRRGRDGGGRARDGSPRPARAGDRGPAPRAVPGGASTRSCPAWWPRRARPGRSVRCLSGAGSTIIAFCASDAEAAACRVRDGRSARPALGPRRPAADLPGARAKERSVVDRRGDDVGRADPGGRHDDLS